MKVDSKECPEEEPVWEARKQDREKFTDLISTEVTSQPLFCEEYQSMSGS